LLAEMALGAVAADGGDHRATSPIVHLARRDRAMAGTLRGGVAERSRPRSRATGGRGPPGGCPVSERSKARRGAFAARPAPELVVSLATSQWRPIRPANEIYNAKHDAS